MLLELLDLFAELLILILVIHLQLLHIQFNFLDVVLALSPIIVDLLFHVLVEFGYVFFTGLAKAEDALDQLLLNPLFTLVNQILDQGLIGSRQIGINFRMPIFVGLFPLGEPVVGIGGFGL